MGMNILNSFDSSCIDLNIIYENVCLHHFVNDFKITAIDFLLTLVLLGMESLGNIDGSVEKDERYYLNIILHCYLA